MKRTVAVISALFCLVPLSRTAAQSEVCAFGSASANSGVFKACPKGDGPTLLSMGLTISVRVVNPTTHQPISGIPAKDIRLEGAGGGLYFCGGPMAAGNHADSATDSNGETTFSGAFAVGGCDQGLVVVVQGNRLVPENTDPLNCTGQYITLPIKVRSTDLNGDGAVTLSDWSQYVALYQNGAYDDCADFDGNNIESIGDLTYMQAHYPQGQPQHECP